MSRVPALVALLGNVMHDLFELSVTVALGIDERPQAQDVGPRTHDEPDNEYASPTTPLLPKSPQTVRGFVATPYTYPLHDKRSVYAREEVGNP